VCGIVGIKSNKVSEQNICSMLSLISHRGPDQLGAFIAKHESIGLGVARLSIIDIENGIQPFVDDSTGIALAFNGEIYNHVELRDELKKRNVHFQTNSDSEVILRLYIAEGDNFLNKLNGQFALSIWDPSQNKLLLARDRIGIRPLFYFFTNETFAFASELKSLLTLNDAPDEINIEALDQIFTFWTTVCKTSMIKGIYHLLPGHKLIFKDNIITELPYWDWPFPDEMLGKSFRDTTEEFHEKFDQSVALRLLADTEVGAYISGGVDSAAIVQSMSKIKGNNIRTYSVGFEDSSYDERPFQRIVHEHLKTRHSTQVCNNETISNEFEDIVWHTETPLFRTAPTPLKLLSKSVNNDGLKVILTGEGADEVLLGYNIFKEIRLRKMLTKYPESNRLKKLFGKLYAYLPHFSNDRYINLVVESYKTTLYDDSTFFSHNYRWNNNQNNKIYFSDDLKKSLQNYCAKSYLKSFIPANFYDSTLLGKAQYLEVTTLLQNYLLSSQGDRMAMSNSVEGRFPFLDHNFIEYMSKVPVKYKLDGLQDKKILRKAFTNKLPREICNREKVAYQAPDIKSFINKNEIIDYASEHLSEINISNNGLFKFENTNRLLKKITLSSLDRLGSRDNMAFVQILSTQIFCRLFTKEYIKQKSREYLKNMNIIRIKRK
jgi:asparagine synthase (glutamine-hydrolysing)